MYSAAATVLLQQCCCNSTLRSTIHNSKYIRKNHSRDRQKLYFDGTHTLINSYSTVPDREITELNLTCFTFSFLSFLECEISLNGNESVILGFGLFRARGTEDVLALAHVHCRLSRDRNVLFRQVQFMCMRMSRGRARTNLISLHTRRDI